MITRLTLRNVVLVDEAELEFDHGMTCITGETGAGKTVLAGAIGLVFGANADAALVGPEGDEAWIEAEFVVPTTFWDEAGVGTLAELRPAGEDRLVLARRIPRTGRSRSLAWGRTVSRSDLAAAGELLVVVASQHSQRRLVSPAWQRDALDRMGDAEHAELVTSMATAWRDVVTAELARDRVEQQAEGLAARELQVRDDLERIELVGPDPDDCERLEHVRTRARRSAELNDALSAAISSLSSDGRDGAVDLLGAAAAACTTVADVDPDIAALADEIYVLQESATAVAGSLRQHLELVADGPSQMEQVEERLSAYDDLYRRFGGTIESVMSTWTSLRAEAELVDDLDGARAAAQADVVAARNAADHLAKQLSTARRALAADVCRRLRVELDALAMSHVRIDVAVDDVECSASGIDRVEIRIAPRADMELRPITEIASGGELSRLSLALQVVLGAADASTVILDEVDAGIGGTTAHAVAARCARLAQSCQVLCITHLAQVAAVADQHLVVERSGDQTTISPRRTDDEIISELCRMVGSDPADPDARKHVGGMRRNRITGARRRATVDPTDGPTQTRLDLA